MDSGSHAGKSNGNSPWTETFFPKSQEEFIGNSEIVAQAFRWADSWNEGKKQKPLLMWGQSGAGKTCLAILIAKLNNWDIFEMNASDLRTKESIERIAGGAAMNSSFDGRLRLILLDEVDRVSAEARADIMGVLVELLDPQQNKAYTDHFIDYPFNLQNVLFIATSNNTKDISTAVLDRLEIIQMPSYTDQEKITIAKSYMFPKVLAESGMTPTDIIIDDNVWEEVVRPLGYDSGIRSLERIIQGLVRKVVFYQLQGKIQPGAFRLTTQNVKEYIPQW